MKIVLLFSLGRHLAVPVVSWYHRKSKAEPFRRRSAFLCIFLREKTGWCDSRVKQTENQNLLTVGSVPKKMLLFAVPIFFSNLFQQLYNAVDSLIVGNFVGEQALAAVGSSASLIMLLIGFVNGVSLGAGVLVARFFGAGD